MKGKHKPVEREYEVTFWDKHRDYAKITIFAHNKKHCKGFATRIKKVLVQLGVLPGRATTWIKPQR